MNSTCISYHYFEASPEYKRNFQHFLTFGCHPGVDVVCVIAGDHTVDLPSLPNVRYEFIANRNFDYGGHSHVVHTHFLNSHYSHFIFLNSSVRGPFLTVHQAPQWEHRLIQLLQQADVGLCGATINIVPPSSRYCIEYRSLYGGQGPASHVQSMCYAMPRSSLQLLVRNGLFNPDTPLDKNQLILSYEIRMSQCLLDHGLNLKCLLPEYNLLDYRQAHQDINPASKGGDPFFHQAYFGRTPHPYETLFTKTNRDLFAASQLDMLAYTMQAAGLAHCNCGLQLQPAEFLHQHQAVEMGQLWAAFKKAIKRRVKKSRR